MKQIISLSSLDELQTIKILAALICTRIIAPMDKGAQAGGIEVDTVRDHESMPVSDLLDEIDYLYKNLDSLDYYSFLGIEKWSPSDKIKKAYYQAVKKFHPDKHLDISSDMAKTRLNSIFSHITEIYKVLSDPEKKRQYDQSIPYKQTTGIKRTGDLARIRCPYKNRRFS